MSTSVSRRTMLKWMAASVSGAVLAGCAVPAAQPAAGEAAPAQAPAAKVEIGWARHGADLDLKTEQTIAELFQARYPDITVKPLVLPWADYNVKIPVMVAGGTAPDTFGAHPALLMQVNDAKQVRAVDDFIKAEANFDYNDVLYPGDANFDGHIMGLPQKSCTHQLRYNKDLFAEAGLPTPGELYWKDKEKSWNWAAFIDMAPKFTKDTTGDGQPDQYFFGAMDGTNNIAVIRSAGGEIFDPEITKCILTEPSAKEGLQFMADLVLKYKVQPPPEMNAGQLGINFPTGKIAIDSCTTCDSPRDLRKGQELPFKWDYVMIPAGKAGFRSWGDTDQIVITTASKNADAAFKWMNYRSSKDAWEESYAKGTVLAYSDGPTRWSIFDTNAYTEPLAGMDINMIKDGYKQTIPNPFMPRCPQPYRVFFTVMTTEIDNLLRGVKSVDQAAADMCTQIEAILKEGNTATSQLQECFCAL